MAALIGMLLALLATPSTVIVLAGETTASDCAGLGFVPGLVCSACSELEQFGLASALGNDCKACCAPDTVNGDGSGGAADTTADRAPKAVLEICN